MNIKYYYYVDMQNTVMPAKNVFTICTIRQALSSGVDLLLKNLEKHHFTGVLKNVIYIFWHFTRGIPSYPYLRYDIS